MMVQGNPQIITDVGQLGGIEFPGATGQGDGAEEGNPGGLKPWAAQQACKTPRSKEALWADKNLTSAISGLSSGHNSQKVGSPATISQMMPWRQEKTNRCRGGG